MARTWRTATTPRITPDETKFSEFSGVVNTRSRRDLGMKSLFVGDNVFISDTNKVTRRDGYSAYRSTGTVWSAYGKTGNLYVIDNGALVNMVSATQDIAIASGFSNKPYCWDDDLGDNAFFVNGLDAGIVRGNVYLPWRLSVPTISGASVVSAATNVAPYKMGAQYTQATFRLLATYITSDGRETAPSEIVALAASPLTNLIRVTCSTAYVKTNIYCTEADGTVFRLVASTTSGSVTFNPARGGERYSAVTTQSLPAGVTHCAYTPGRVYVGMYDANARASGVWCSEEYAYHRFNVGRDMHALPGELGLMAWNNKGVILGTSRGIWQYHMEEDRLETCVDYGVVPGRAGECDAEGRAYFWTERGICRAYPFENLTEKDVGMAAGGRAVGSVVYINGVQQFIAVAQGGGVPFNYRRERT